VWAVELAVLLFLVLLDLLPRNLLAGLGAFCPAPPMRIAFFLAWIGLVYPGWKFFSWLLEKAPRGFLSYFAGFLVLFALITYFYGVMLLQAWDYRCYHTLY
jgi:hypothetical protein